MGKEGTMGFDRLLGPSSSFSVESASGLISRWAPGDVVTMNAEAPTKLVPPPDRDPTWVTATSCVLIQAPKELAAQ